MISRCHCPDRICACDPGANWRKLSPNRCCAADVAQRLRQCGQPCTRRSFEKIYPVEPDANISIHNRDGAILVYGSDVNELRVRSLKRAYSHERLNQIAIDVSTKPGAVSITAKFPPQPKWAFSDHSGTVDCTIVVPATASISALDLNAGEVLLDSMRGPEVRARLNDGRIFARNCFTNLDLTMNRGTLTLVVRLVGTGKILGAGKRGTGKRVGLFAHRSSLSICSRTLCMERSLMISIIFHLPRIPLHVG